MLQKSAGFNSLDYDTIYNDGELHYLDKRKLGRSVWGFTGTTFIRWFIFVFIGIITGAMGRFMEVSIEYIHKWRNMAFERFAPAPAPRALRVPSFNPLDQLSRASGLL